MPYKLLESINSPADVRRLSRPDLKLLAAQLREFVLQSVSKTGGHLSSNLGTVELTIDLHHVSTRRATGRLGRRPQTYPHKVLTGRREGIGSLRQLGGISGARARRVRLAFGTAHSSTSISAVLGMAWPPAEGETRKAVAVIGDGAMSAGMALGVEQRRRVADRHAGDPERQRHVDLAAGQP